MKLRKILIGQRPLRRPNRFGGRYGLKTRRLFGRRETCGSLIGTLFPPALKRYPAAIFIVILARPCT
ncbi:MAG: hypothetical protein WA384_16995, partial [Rhodomicrobium sp.]